MIDLFTIKQPCIVTDEKFSGLTLNRSAEQLLKHFSEAELMHSIKRALHNRVERGKTFQTVALLSTTERVCAMTLQASDIEGQMLVLLSPNVLPFAFGDWARSTADSAFAVATWDGLIVDADTRFVNLTGLNIDGAIQADIHHIFAEANEWQSLQKGKTLSFTPVTCDQKIVIQGHVLSVETHPPLLGLSCRKLKIRAEEISNDEDATPYIEALKVAKVQAEQASEAKGRFLATMSHEIRSPLNAIINMAQLLLKTSLTPKQKQYAEVAHSGGETLLSLINDILDFSKIEAGHLSLNEAPFDLVSELENLTALFWQKAHESGIELNINIMPNCCGQYLGDSQRLRQILINLINNAIKFTEHGGVTISALSQTSADGKEHIEISISDTGIGMSEIECATVFDAFVQVQSAENRQFNGTGLGLAIVKQLTAIMGGKITVNSRVAQGTTFTVNLPLRKTVSHDSESIQATNSIYLGGFQLEGSTKSIDTAEQNESRESYAKIYALVDCRNKQLESSVIVQLRSFGFDCKPMDALTQPLIDSYDRVYIFGEPDDLQSNIKRYHQTSERYIIAQQITYVALLDDHQTTNYRDTLLRGFSTSLDKPILPSKLQDFLQDKVSESCTLEEVNSETIATILLVEDGETNRAVASALLESLNIECDFAHNGQEALTLVEKRTYPLILMDLSMPVMDGLEATTHIRAGTSPNKETPIIALTANAFAEDRAACLASGMNDYLSKPIDNELFSRKVRQWLQCSVDISASTNISDDRSEPTTPDEKKQAKVTQHSGAMHHQPSESHPPSSTNENPDNAQNEPSILDPHILNQLIRDTSVNSLEVILKIYCKEVEERIPKMELLLSQEIWSTLADEAHILKSSSASFGAVELAARAKIIELSVRSGEYLQVREAMDSIQEISDITLAAQKTFLQSAIQAS